MIVKALRVPFKAMRMLRSLVRKHKLLPIKWKPYRERGKGAHSLILDRPMANVDKVVYRAPTGQERGCT